MGDDFAFVAKAAKWGNGAIFADVHCHLYTSHPQISSMQGVAILFGVMFGRDVNGVAHAYNWYLAPLADLNSIFFFNPQTGEMVDPGHTGYFGVF